MSPLAVPASNVSRFELERALQRHQLAEAALGALTHQLELTARRGRVDGFTFIGGDTQALKAALERLSPEQLEAVAGEAVARAFPKADASKQKELVEDVVRELTGAATSNLAREYKDFIAGRLDEGARHFRSVAADARALQAMVDRLAAMPEAERAATAAAWGLSADNTRPTVSELAVALADRGALMQRSARELREVSGAAHTLYRISSYPGLEAEFIKAKGLDADSVAARAVFQATQAAHGEAVLRSRLDYALAIGTTAAGGAIVGAAALGTGAAVGLAAPGTLLSTARKFGEANLAVDAAKAGESAGVMGRGRIADAEGHRKVVLAMGAVELAAPAVMHGLPGLHPSGVVMRDAIAGGVKEGVAAATVLGVESAAMSHDPRLPRGKDALTP